MRNVETAVHVERNFSPLSTGHAGVRCECRQICQQTLSIKLNFLQSTVQPWLGARDGAVRSMKETCPGKFTGTRPERVGSLRPLRTSNPGSGH
jgi:hypothetical protein